MSTTELTAQPQAAAPARKRPTSSWARGLASGEWALVGLIVIMAVVGGVTTSGFATTDNFRAILIAASITGIVAVGMTFVTVSGNLVSLGIQQTVVLAALLHLHMLSTGSGLLVAVVVPVAALIVVGAVQATLVIFGLNTVVTTLATGAIIYGSMASITGGRPVTSKRHSERFLGDSSILGAPITIYAFAVITVVAAVLFKYSVIGRQTRLMGANSATARVSGISRIRIVFFVFAVMSVCAAFAGILTAAQLGQATSNDLTSLTIDVVAAVLVGGTLLTGGTGSPVRSALGAIVIALLNNVMVLRNYQTGVRLAAEGALVVVVVLLLQLASRRSRRATA